MNEAIAIKEFEIDVRRFEFERDYEEISTWWKAHGWSPVSPDLLPKRGFVAEYDGVKVCAIWLYLTDSKLALCEYLISNPQSDKTIRRDAIRRVTNKALRVAKDQGFRICWTFFNHPGLVKTYGDLGFTETDKGLTHMIKHLELMEA